MNLEEVLGAVTFMVLAPVVSVLAYIMCALAVLLFLWVVDHTLPTEPVPPFCDVDPRCSPRFYWVRPSLGVIEDFHFHFRSDDNSYELIYRR